LCTATIAVTDGWNEKAFLTAGDLRHATSLSSSG
jgi:hypothetical protein